MIPIKDASVRALHDAGVQWKVTGSTSGVQIFKGDLTAAIGRFTLEDYKGFIQGLINLKKSVALERA